MRPIKVTVADASGGAKNSNAVVLDYYGRPEVSLQVVVTGTVNYTIQQTLDNPLTAGATITWFNHPDANLVAQTVNRQGNYAYIPTAVRIVLNSGTGSVVLTVTQAGLHP
jgi:hypothetical protein